MTTTTKRMSGQESNYLALHADIEQLRIHFDAFEKEQIQINWDNLKGTIESIERNVFPEKWKI